MGPKYFILCIMLFLSCAVEAKSSLCRSENINTDSTVVSKLKQRFIEEIGTHYNNLSISRRQKDSYIRRYSNPDITVCTNIHKLNQKVVYIEYDRNWWGNLYFVVIKDKKILTWQKINTHGAITKYIRWRDDKSFFYEDSTHQGSRTRKLCSFQDSFVKCQSSLSR